MGSAFSFAGAGQVAAADRANLNVQRLTMEAWVYPTALDGSIETILNKEFRRYW